MNYLTHHGWLHREKGAGLEDLEDILSAPTPSLGAPLRRAQPRTAQEAGSGPTEEEPAPEQGEQVVKQRERQAVCCSITHAASVSPKISPRSCSAAERPGRTAEGAAAPALLSGDAVQQTAVHSRADASQHAGAEGMPACRLGQAGSLRSSSEGLACLLSANDSTTAVADCQAAEVREEGSSMLWPSIRVPRLGAYEGMTIAASLAGGIAGGAAAGPLGVSLGAKGGALMIAAGAGVCGAAHHCYTHGLPSSGLASGLLSAMFGKAESAETAPQAAAHLRADTPGGRWGIGLWRAPLQAATPGGGGSQATIQSMQQKLPISCAAASHPTPEKLVSGKAQHAVLPDMRDPGHPPAAAVGPLHRLPCAADPLCKN